MYLHLGGSVIVPKESVIGIFDLDVSSQSNRTREFLAKSERRGQIVSINEELPRSFVLVNEGERTRVYLSQLSSATLNRRSVSPPGNGAAE